MNSVERLSKTVRRHFLSCFVVGLGLFAAPSALAAEYYVATTGSDSNAGTLTAPFATVTKAQTAASAGDTVLIRGGRFAFSGSGTVGVSFTKSGTANAPINYFAYPGEVPIFDLTNLTPSNRVTGLDVHCNYIHVRGLEVMGVHQYESGSDSWGVRIQGSNDILENLNVHNNDAPGIFITSGANNLILNCDSHSNYDYLEGGGSGDGFGCHSSGGGNILRGCRAYDNSDDGFDFINAAGSCTVEDSFSFRNGWVPPDSTQGTPGAASGNGAGFKAGGYGSPPSVPSTGAATHTVQRCVAVENRSQGFYANHHPGQINFFNNTAYNNPANYNMLSDSGYPSSHVICNNVAFGTGGNISNLNGGTATYNSWNLSVTVSTADFQGVDLAEALGTRSADGSMPTLKFMHLVAGSDLINAGTDVGLTYVGSAPDLGAFEYGGTTAGTGGSSGAGGASGTGGAIAGPGGAGTGGRGGASGSTSGGTPTGTGGAGAAGSSGVYGVGGSSGKGGATSGSGGSVNGGASGSGGSGGGGATIAQATGGGAGTSPTGTGGASATNSASGGTAGSSTAGSATSGCGCGIGSTSQHSPVSLSVVALLAFVLLPRRRGARE